MKTILYKNYKMLKIGKVRLNGVLLHLFEIHEDIGNAWLFQGQITAKTLKEAEDILHYLYWEYTT